MIDIKWQDVGWGCLGLNGNLGFDAKRVQPPADLVGWNYLSAHAPSSLLVEVTRPIKLAGFFSSTSTAPASSASFFASGNYVGKVNKLGESTLTNYGEFHLWAGTHLLEVTLTLQDKSGCHSVWAYKDAD
jgi:hypothetical protein